MSTSESPQLDDRTVDHVATIPVSSRIVPWLLTVTGLVGFGAAFVLTVEKFSLLADSSYTPSCDFSATISCGTVMTTPAATLFGFPNSLIGIAAFAVLGTVGVVLWGGARVSPWVWVGLQVGLLLGVVFVHWLIYQSVFEIGALCPYCMVVWAVTVPAFWYTTVHNVRRGEWGEGVQRGVDALVKFHWVPVALWYVGVAALAWSHFA